MTQLQKILDSYGDNYWDFKTIKKSGIHKIANYPAMMVAPMQHKIIEDICNSESNVTNILDPFHGSGTTLVEGKKFKLDVIGIDINPLANLITTVKLQGIDEDTIYNSIEKLIYNINEISKNSTKVYTFSKAEKWFRKDVIKDLSILRESIMLEENKKNRLYFWVCLSDIIRRFSNTRNSTFKLHIKDKETIKNMANNSIKEFIKSVKKNHEFLQFDSHSDCRLIQGDSIQEFQKIADNSIDLICTSPPYGDNGTTVTYGQFSILSLLWIDKKDINLSDEDLISNYSSIDSNSLGHNKNNKKIFSLPSLKNLISKISKDKQKKVLNFFNDYFFVLEEMIRTLKKNHLMVLTLGNRRVDNIEIRLDEITKEYCLKNLMNLEAELKRGIPHKNMPTKISHIQNHGAVTSMNKETVLILRKKGD